MKPVIHLDRTGGGGAGIGWDAQVEFRANLPITIGTPIIGSIYLVEKPTTILLGAYTTYQSGLYIKDADTGSLNDWRRLNVKVRFTDGEWAIVNTADQSKVLKFLTSAITTATTRIVTWQDKDGSPTYFDDLTFLNTKISNRQGTTIDLDNLSDAFSHIWSAGITEGCALTDNGNGTISLASGEGTLRAVADPHEPLYAVEILEDLNIALSDNSTNYVSIQWGTPNPTTLVSTSESSFNGLNILSVYIVYRNGNSLKVIDLRDQNTDFIKRANVLFRDFSKFIHSESGSLIQDNGDLSAFVQAGSFHYQTIKLPHPQFDTSIIGTANENVFTLFNRNGAGWTETPNEKLIDTTLWDNDNAVPDVLANQKWSVSFAYVGHDTPSFLNIVMGQQQYDNQADAENAFQTLPALPPILSGIGSLIGFYVYQKSVIAFDNILNLFEQRFVAVSTTPAAPPSDQSTVTARRTTTLPLTAGFVPITFDTTETQNNIADLEHNVITSRIDIKTTGVHWITYNLDVESFNTTNKTLSTRIIMDGVTVITAGSQDVDVDEPNTTNHPVKMSKQFSCAFSTTGYIELEIKTTSISGTPAIDAGALFTATKMTGETGATGNAGVNGSAGADGDITWQGVWVSQNYITNQAVSYLGSSYVCHTNTTLSQIPTDTNYWDVLADKGDTGAAGGYGVYADNAYVASFVSDGITGLQDVTGAVATIPVGAPTQEYEIECSFVGQTTALSGGAWELWLHETPATDTMLWRVPLGLTLDGVPIPMAVVRYIASLKAGDSVQLKTDDFASDNTTTTYATVAIKNT